MYVGPLTSLLCRCILRQCSVPLWSSVFLACLPEDIKPSCNKYSLSEHTSVLPRLLSLVLAPIKLSLFKVISMNFSLMAVSLSDGCHFWAKGQRMAQLQIYLPETWELPFSFLASAALHVHPLIKSLSFCFLDSICITHLFWFPCCCLISQCL